MLRFTKSARFAAAALCAGLGLSASAEVLVNVCHGDVRVVSQQATAAGIDLEVEVNITDCVGECIGSLEYQLLFVDADNAETKWQLTENWNWRPLDGKPFTLQVHSQAHPSAPLKEVTAMKLGRCSCSTVVSDQ